MFPKFDYEVSEQSDISNNFSDNLVKSFFLLVLVQEVTIT